jgi:hypothetical protein
MLLGILHLANGRFPVHAVTVNVILLFLGLEVFRRTENMEGGELRMIPHYGIGVETLLAQDIGNVLALGKVRDARPQRDIPTLAFGVNRQDLGDSPEQGWHEVGLTMRTGVTDSPHLHDPETVVVCKRERERWEGEVLL